MSWKKRVSIFICVMGLFVGSASQAQVQRTVKRSVATVLFSSIGGAILGLSTLSFYGKPQDHIDNVTYGALLGGLAGVGYLAYDASVQLRQKPAYDYSEIEKDLRLHKKWGLPQGENPQIFNIAYSF